MNEQHEAELVRLLDALDAPKEVRDLARAFVHRAVEARLHAGRGIEGVVASAVFAAFRRAGTPHSHDEIAAVSGVNRSTLGQLNKQLARELEIELEPADPHEFVRRFAASLDMDDEIEAWAHEIIDKSAEAGLLSGVAPAGIAGGALYIADHTYPDRAQHIRERIPRYTQAEIAAVAGVTTVTIRHRYAEQAHLLGIDGHGSILAHRRHLFDMD
jgi:transcription initiation factor TFIIB